jgi:hypothetical protein
MKKTISSQNSIVLVVFTLLLISYACRKHFVHNNDGANYTKQYNTFFDVTGVNNPEVLAIVANVKQQEARMHFVQPFIQKDGYLLWRNAFTITKNNETAVVIPFAKQGATEITGYIQAQKLVGSNSYAYEFFRTRNMANYNFTNAASRLYGTRIRNIINYFNYTIYNKDSFTLASSKEYEALQIGQGNTNIPWQQVKGVVNPNTNGNTRAIVPTCGEGYHPQTTYYFYEGIFLGTITNCVQDAVVVVGHPHHNAQSVISPTEGLPHWWVWGGDVGGGNGDIPIGGGGVGHTPVDSICNYYPIDNNPQQPIDPPTYYGGDPGGWQQCISEEPVYNPYIADNVIIDTSITNNFPCLVKIIDTISTFGNLNQQAQVALSQVFRVNQKIHLKLIIEDTLRGTSVSAKTNRKVSLLTQAQFDDGHFGALMSINPDMLENATKEYIITTIVHEAMHAYIDYIYTEYNAGRVDSNYIKQHFPIFWGRVQRSPSEISQHNNMALNWVQHIVEPLYAFTNNEIDSLKKDEIYNALGWAGLEETDVFTTRIDKCNILAINKVSRNKNINAPFNITFPDFPTCNGQYNFSATTLNLKKLCD